MTVVLGSNDNTAASPTFRDVDGSANSFVYTLTPIVFSGNYPTGGDTLDLTPIMQAAGITGGIANLLIATPVAQGPGASNSGLGGSYTFLKGSALTNGKLKINKGYNTEYSNGAYGTDVLTDVVVLECWWRKAQ